jgi:hypothetical protein
LIAAGIPLNSPPATGPSAAALAIEAGRFDLADLLMSKGAGTSLNDFHKSGPSGDMLSLLGRLLAHHSQSTLKCLEHLWEKKEIYWKFMLNPIANQTKNLTAVHILALTPPTSYNHHTSISDRIIQRVLELFPNPQSLGSQVVHPKLGNPLCAAVISGNLGMVSALLSGYKTEIYESVEIQMPSDLTGLPVTITPHQLAVELAC